MPRTKNVTPKYNLKVMLEDDLLHDNNYCSLLEISEYMKFPYTSITDIYEGRRKSLNKYQKCRFFPNMEITKIALST